MPKCDIALAMNIAKPSVTQAINALQKSGLVLHEPYGPVVLTKAGEDKANQIWQRHQTLYKFLREILQVTPATAEADACRMEHVLSSETFRRIKDYMEKHSAGKEDRPHSIQSLNDLPAGTRARVVSLGVGNKLLKKRLLEMGIVPGAEVEIERMAPLGDQVEILLNGCHLSLRRSEAAQVKVELL